MCAEGIVLNDITPVGIDHPFSGFQRTDTVLPVILISKASARPAKHRDLDLSQRVNNILPDSGLIRNMAVLSDKVSAVNASSQMLGKMPVNIPADYPRDSFGSDRDFNHAAPFI